MVCFCVLFVFVSECGLIVFVCSVSAISCDVVYAVFVCACLWLCLHVLFKITCLWVLSVVHCAFCVWFVCVFM